MEHEDYMREALTLALEAAGDGEVPVGCVIVRGGEIIGRGKNRREANKSALAHAEIEAIYEACKAIGAWRLNSCDLYVTLEPCPMCAGAIINARVTRVFYGAGDSKVGACGGVLNIFEEGFGHRPQLVGGILREDCARPLAEFFKKLRD